MTVPVHAGRSALNVRRGSKINAFLARVNFSSGSLSTSQNTSKAKGEEWLAGMRSCTVPFPDSTVVMSWKGVSGGLKAAKLGHDVVMTPDTYLYLDFYQFAALEPYEYIQGLDTAYNIYSYNTTSALDEQHHKACKETRGLSMCGKWRTLNGSCSLVFWSLLKSVGYKMRWKIGLGFCQITPSTRKKSSNIWQSSTLAFNWEQLFSGKVVIWKVTSGCPLNFLSMEQSRLPSSTRAEMIDTWKTLSFCSMELWWDTTIARESWVKKQRIFAKWKNFYPGRNDV